MSEIMYRVPDMSCGHCKQAVSQELLAVKGVDFVAVDLLDENVRAAEREQLPVHFGDATRRGESQADRDTGRAGPAEAPEESGSSARDVYRRAARAHDFYQVFTEHKTGAGLGDVLEKIQYQSV